MEVPQADSSSERSPHPPSKRFRSAWDSIGVAPKQGVRAVKRGLSIRHLEQFLGETQLPKAAVLKVLKLTASEYQQRSTSRRLNPLESERLWRLAKIYKKSLDLFEGNVEQAARWLRTPQRALQGISPLLNTVTEPGAAEVEELIGRIEYGVLS